jgi:hypothetical protein
MRVVNIVSIYAQVSNSNKTKNEPVNPKLDLVTELSSADELAKHSNNCLSGKSVV